MPLRPRRGVIDAAVAACIIAARFASAQTPPPTTQATPPTAESSGIEEVTVTAQRRAENIQDVPITIQALTSEQLGQLNVANFDEFIKYLPNVTQSSFGPAQSEIFMRGLSVGGGGGGQGGGTTGAFPAVAIYLDEQSGQVPGRNLDIQAVDLERVEVLEGPQGTLFGGGALSGVLRYITNKPKLDVTEGNVDAAYGPTAHGDPNSSASAMINLPLIEGTLGVRGVIYDDRQGGYINNVPSTFSRSGTDLGLARYNGGVVPTNSPSINNYNIAANAINPVSYTGARVELLWKVNDDWNALLTQSYQNMDAEGVFYDMPFSSQNEVLNSNAVPISGTPLPPLSVSLFNPSYDKDKFENTALVVNGNVANLLKVVYSGAYLVRNVDQVQDYTNYARGVFGYYYQCAGYSSNPATGFCDTPSTVWREHERNTHMSHELRLSTPDDWRIRGLAGVYWEKYNILDQTQWAYVTLPTCSPTNNVNCYLPIEPWPGSPAFTPLPDTGFFDDVERGYKQLAEFASIDFDIIPKVLTITGGIRHFQYESNETGGDVGSFYCKAFAPTTYFGFCGQNPIAGAFGSSPPYGTDFALRQTAVTNTGDRARANITWHVTDQAMVYYTWSQGFRPGQFNRSTSCHVDGLDGLPQYCIPAITVPDNVTNNEVGWKTEWFDHHLLFNAAIYQEFWDNAQTGFFDPQGGLGNLAFATNGPTYRVRGFEPQIIARPLTGLTFQLSAAWNSSSQTNSPYLIDNNPASDNFGKPVCQVKGTTCTPIPNVYGPLGSPTAFSPPFNTNARIRYEWSIGDYTPFVQFGGQHRGHMVTSTGYVAPFNISPFTTYDAAVGVSKGDWEVQLYSQNLTNASTPQAIGDGQFVLDEIVPRPRIIELRFTYHFTQANSK
ncbi:MAG TPA: TonB-dependent receptor [Steroidobacteraceae bacterium]|nr:TonB-dependent receptor [Steroidobacteraceae bacterium]